MNKKRKGFIPHFGGVLNRKSAGFTIAELMVVAVIIAILASIGLPMYLKTVESAKAGDAVAIGHLLGNAYRMYYVDNPQVLNGTVTNACNSTTTACSQTDTSACRLVRCNYVARQNWDSSAYSFTVGANAVTIARKTGASPGTNTSPYKDWSYTFSRDSGACASSGGAPSCPNF